MRGGTGYKKRPHREFGGNGNVLCLDRVVGYRTIYAWARTQKSTLKKVNFNICTPYLNKLAFNKIPFGTKSLLMSRICYVLYNSFSKMYMFQKMVTSSRITSSPS